MNLFRDNRRLDYPTYIKDTLGEVKRTDERDIVFSRADLFTSFGTDSPEFTQYYQAHPELLAYDTKISRMPPTNRSGGIDYPMFNAPFSAIDRISPDCFVDGRPAAVRLELSPRQAQEKVKAFARLSGADLVGTGPLRQEWVYSHVGQSHGNQKGYQPRGTPIDLSQHTHAVSLGFRMDYDLTRWAPGFPVQLATARGYAASAWAAIQLAEYIRKLGYSARAHHLDNYKVLAVPIAVDCGMGELSRAGYLLTREFGLGLRLSIVTTDLPLEHGRPVDIGVQSFCARCRICANQCPVGAIPGGEKVEHNGVLKWKLDEQKCYLYWHATGTNCGICMAVCPWTRPPNPFHRAMATLASIKGPHQSLMVHASRWFDRKPPGNSYPRFLEPPEE